MSSFALWFESNEDSHEGFVADVHFNLWNLHYRKAKPPFLDVGIKIYQPQGYSKVFFFVPWRIEKKRYFGSWQLFEIHRNTVYRV